ncbi:unnamed protein product [Linum trigynum]|uniref:Uncharacterized protein n=1 Tax=Linum trigynum TaxID=586398 RepID=A0AAV2CCZ4_9ROSI
MICSLQPTKPKASSLLQSQLVCQLRLALTHFPPLSSSTMFAVLQQQPPLSPPPIIDNIKQLLPPSFPIHPHNMASPPPPPQPSPSSPPPPPSSIINPTFTEHEWLKQIDKSIQLGPETITQNLSSIFEVPASLSSAQPQSYAPQLVGLGPFHHFQRRLYQNEPLKLAGAELALKRLDFPDFPNLVRQFVPLLPTIRCFYDTHLDLADETLAWVLAIDALFVVEMLYNPQFLLPRTANSFSFSEKLRAITGDIVMLESQIPIYSLFSPEISTVLAPMLESFCRVLAPFKLGDLSGDAVNLKPKHLLDHVYQLILQGEDKPPPPTRVPTDGGEPPPTTGEGSTRIDVSKLDTLADELSEKVDDAYEDIGSPSTVTDEIEKLAQIQVISTPISSIFKILDVLGFSTIVSKALEDEKTLVPSATDLKSVGVKFSATTAGLRSINFNVSTAVLTLPVFLWKPSIEIVIRNLVAYESLAKPDSAILTRYTQMMRAMVQSKEDVKLLKKEGIVEGNVDDEVVVALFGGMVGGSSPVAPAAGTMTVLDATVGKVNEYYSGKPMVLMSKICKLLVNVGLRVVMLVGAIVLLGMFAVQTYCSIYACGGTGGGVGIRGLLRSPVGQSVASSLWSSV